MASAQQQQRSSQYTLPPPPPMNNDFRLPSLKDLNFQYRPPPPHEVPSSAPSASPQVDQQPHQQRHESASWSRQNSSHPSTVPSQHLHQHSQPPLANHEHSSSKNVQYSSPRHDHGGYMTPGVPMSAQVAPPASGPVPVGPGSRGDDSAHGPAASKRSRTSSTLVSPRDGRAPNPPYPVSQHASYPPPPPPPPQSYHTIPAPPVQPPSQMHHQPAPTSYPPPPPPPGYGSYPSPYVQHRAYHMHQPHQQPHQPPPPAAHHAETYQPHPPPPWEQQQQQQSQQSQQSQSHHPQQHHTPVHHQHPPPHHQPHAVQQHQPPPPHQQQPPPPTPQQPHHHPSMSFARTTPLVPTTVEMRPQNYASGESEKGSTRENALSEIVKQCTLLYEFADRYAKLQVNLPHVQPTAQEVAEMAQRATQVVRLLEEFRRLVQVENERQPLDGVGAHSVADDHRPPKRPWEDLGDDIGGPEGISNAAADSMDPSQSTAEKDMELIRTKRATSSAGTSAATGQQKSKYRKRSRATPPGKCHSCNIRETPEWRRGPDGARTLCNACGLHYAKLVRKREKAGVSGDAAQIDMEMLRASARAADVSGEKARSQGQAQQSMPPPPVQPQPQAPHQQVQQTSHQRQGQHHQHEAAGSTIKNVTPGHHQSSFQLTPLSSGSSSAAASDPRAMPDQASHQSSHHHHHPHHQTSNHQQQSVMSSTHDPSITGPPPPPWVTSTPRSYVPNQVQHQSFMRTSHSVSSGASPR